MAQRPVLTNRKLMGQSARSFDEQLLRWYAHGVDWWEKRYQRAYERWTLQAVLVEPFFRLTWAGNLPASWDEDLYRMSGPRTVSFARELRSFTRSSKSKQDIADELTRLLLDPTAESELVRLESALHDRLGKQQQGRVQFLQTLKSAGATIGLGLVANAAYDALKARAAPAADEAAKPAATGTGSGSPGLPDVSTSASGPPRLDASGLKPLRSDLSGPFGVAVDADGHIYVVESDRHRLAVLTTEGDRIRDIGKLGSGRDGLQEPSGIALGHNGILYVADTRNLRIQTFRRDGRPIASIPIPADVSGRRPRWVAVDDEGNVFVTFEYISTIVKMNRDGGTVAKWSLPSASTPQGIALTSGGRMYVADSGTHCIHELGPSERDATSWGALGEGPGEFYRPSGLAIDRRGNLYVADTGNNRIQRFSSGKKFDSQWSDGLQSPRAIAVEG